MTNSATIAVDDPITAAQHNALRADVLDPATGHRHEGGTTGRLVRPAGLDPAGSVAGQVPTSTGPSTAPTWQAIGVGASVFGDGSDGNVTIATNTTLTRDMYYNNLTVNAGFWLNTDGYRVFVLGTLTNNGTIHRNGNAASGSTAGAALVARVLGGSAAGAAGQTSPNTAGIAGSPIASSLGGNGGAGGAATGAAGGPGGVASITAAQGTLRDLIGAVRGRLIDGAAVAGGAGGGSGGTSIAPSGAGGGGGGVVMICARTLNNGSGTISANGGAGGVGHSSSGTGGGGGGGVLLLVYQSLISGVQQVAGGTSPPSGGGGGTGVTGAPGTVIRLLL